MKIPQQLKSDIGSHLKEFRDKNDSYPTEFSTSKDNPCLRLYIGDGKHKPIQRPYGHSFYDCAGQDQLRKAVVRLLQTEENLAYREHTK